MKKIIRSLTFCLLLSSCSDLKYIIRQTNLKKFGEEKVSLRKGYTCDRDNYELFMNEAHEKRRRYRERTGQNISLTEAIDILCKELDDSVFSRKDKHISLYELGLVNNKDYETPLWGVK